MNLGIYGGFNADVIMPEYSTPFYWLYRDSENFLVMNPRVWLNPAGVKAYGALFLYIAEAWFYLSFSPMIGSPLEYQALWSLDNMGNFCHSLSAYLDVFDFEITMVWKSYECVFGAFGYYGWFTSSTTPDDREFLDCEWRAYE